MYYPIIRTREAELFAFEHISIDSLDSIVPIFELTRSRRTIKDKEGLIEKNIERILNITDGRQFIIDFTTDSELDNSQIAAFSNKANGFYNWCNFCLQLKQRNNNIIPCLALIGDCNDEDLLLEINNLSQNFEKLAFRIPLNIQSSITNQNMLTLIDEIIRKNLDIKNKFLFIFDFSYIPKEYSTDQVYETHISLLTDFISKLQLIDNPLIIASSSFPRSVTEYSSEQSGNFPIKELILYPKFHRSIKSLQYGDYASIHPIMYSSFGGSWIPRIDIPYVDRYYFFRYRREEKGYIRAAGDAMSFLYSQNLSSDFWGIQEISKASSGSPSKSNPSFWISIRINLHVYNILKQLSVLNF